MVGGGWDGEGRRRMCRENADGSEGEEGSDSLLITPSHALSLLMLFCIIHVGFGFF